MAGAVLPTQSIDTHAVEWLALSLTAGLGTTKARRLVEHFGSVQEVFRASLTELEALASRQFRHSLWGLAAPWNWPRKSWHAPLLQV